MSQWKADDSAANSVWWGPATVNKTNNTANRAALFGNTTADAFVTGQTIGVYGVDSAEASYETWTLIGAQAVNVGTSAILTGNSTTALTVNGGTSSVTALINVASLVVGTVSVNAAGQGYTNGDIVTITASGTGTQAKFKVTANATGNVTAVTVESRGNYTVFPSATANTANTTGAGTGLRLNVTAGVGNLTIANAGKYTARPAVVNTHAVSNQSTQTATGVRVNLLWKKDRPATHQGWVKVTQGSGGRAGRRTTEVLVAQSSMSGDAENTQFPNTA